MLPHNGNIFNGQSQVQLSLGNIYLDAGCAPSGSTGFKIRFTGVVGVDQDGVEHVGTNLVQPAEAPYVLGAGGAMWVRADFMDFAYNGPGAWDPDWDAAHYMKSYKVSFEITFLQWLEASGSYGNLTAACKATSTITASPNLTYIGGGLTKFS